jgi:hypothetical protein
MRTVRAVVVATAAVLALAGLAPVAAATGASSTQHVAARPAGPTPGDRATSARLTRAAGIQTAPKHRTRPLVAVGGHRYPAADPYLADLPSGQPVDWSYWRGALAAGSRTQQAVRRHARVPTPYLYREREPVGQLRHNDWQSAAERLANFGTARRSQAVRITGALSTPQVPDVPLTTQEDQGSIKRATATHMSRRKVSVVVHSRIGDGPFGSSGRGTGDFDFYLLHATAGRTIDTSTWGSHLDTVLALYDASGHVLEANDDAVDGQVYSRLSHRVSSTGYYYVMVAGFSDAGSLPADPFRSSSGAGAGDEGSYRLRITSRAVDADFYSVQLHSGDVLTGSLTGKATEVQVHRVDGRAMVGSMSDASGAYPIQSPLPGGGASFAYVAESPGWYAVSAARGLGAYHLLLEAYRPGTTGTRNRLQTVFLDYDGARLNTTVFGGNGVVALSPLRRFLPRWGLTAADEDVVESAVTATVKENLRQTLLAQGLNHRLDVRVVDSRHASDDFGSPDVSRVLVGGTIAQSGVPTIGIAQSIDPGNYAHEETALVLLDTLSARAGSADSLNTYLRARSDRVAFVGRALGNLVSHETGHLIGSFHTDSGDSVSNLMDAGGQHTDRMYGVGRDHVGGTSDDTDVDFGEDAYLPEEGFTGLQDTMNNSAWAFLPGNNTP